jgi:hypothetical protein
MFEKVNFWNEAQWAKVKDFWPPHVPNLEELGLTVSSSLFLCFFFWVKTIRVQLRSETKVLSLTKPLSQIGSREWTILPNKTGTNLETKAPQN